MKALKNICKLDEYDDYVSFRAVCDCLEHEQNIIIETDTFGFVTATFYAFTKPSYCWYSFFERLKIAIKIIFNCDDVEIDSDFTFHEEGLRDYITCLNEALEKLTHEKDI